MYYGDGSIYEGEWLEDKRNGSGMLRLSKFSFRLILESIHLSTLGASKGLGRVYQYRMTSKIVPVSSHAMVSDN